MSDENFEPDLSNAIGIATTEIFDSKLLAMGVYGETMTGTCNIEENMRKSRKQQRKMSKNHKKIREKNGKPWSVWIVGFSFFLSKLKGEKIMWLLKGMKLSDIPDDKKWYAVETAFVDGKLLESKCCFAEDGRGRQGIQIASHSEQPVNSCKREFFDRIELHTDWFETMALAKAFSEGKITYIHHYDAYYKASIKSTLRRYRSREIVEVCEEKGIMPYKEMW